MPVLYNGQSIVPAPLISIEPQFQNNNDGANTGIVYNIVLRGTIVSVPPGTTPIPNDAKLGVILAKQKALQEIFGVNGKVLEVFSPNGSGITKFNPIVKSISFAEGIWVDRCDYTVTLEAIRPDESIQFNVSDTSETWEIEEAGTSTIEGAGMAPLWRVSHNLSAKGRTVFDADGNIPEGAKAWEQARDWCISRLGFLGNPIDKKKEVGINDDLNPLNHQRTESINVVDGGVSISESWVLISGTLATEDYTASVKYSPEEATATTTVTVSGSVKGVAAALNNPAEKLANASSYFNTFVREKLFNRALSAAGENASLNEPPTSASIDYNYNEGAVNYTFEYSDRFMGDDETAYDTFIVSKKIGVDSSETIVTIQGTVIGRISIGEPNALLLKYERAQTYWGNIQQFLYTRAVDGSGVIGLKNIPISANVENNIFEASISYTYEYSNREDLLARNDYTISIASNREDGRSIISIEGTVTGLLSTVNDGASRKYVNAFTYWNAWEPQVLPRAKEFAGANLNPIPISMRRADNKYQGVINYSYEFDNNAEPTIPGALSQQVSISDRKGGQGFAVIPVIDNGDEGPVMQDLNFVKEKARTVTLNVTMKKDFDRPETDVLIFGYAPTNAVQMFLESDEETWNKYNNTFQRSVTWIYK